MKKLKIVDYIFQNSKKINKVNIKFIGKEALAYDFLFFFRSFIFQQPFSRFNFIEEWQEDNAEFYLVHHNYNWNTDIYNFYKMTKIIDFGVVKLVIK